MSKSLEVRFEGLTLQAQLPKEQRGDALRKQKLQVYHSPVEEIKLWCNNRFLAYKKLEVRSKTAEVISIKEINSTIVQLHSHRTVKPTVDHPWKRKYFLKMVAKKSR